ncbi:MAG: hypothetical protein H6814_07520 [Phycisphaeraceae bacterium]|nr:hypothetical protein [Phycisphaeraceae bacterium]
MTTNNTAMQTNETIAGAARNPVRLSESDATAALRDHLVARATEARLSRGLYIDAEAIMSLLDDRSLVRYPVGVRFDDLPLEPGEFAWPMPLGDRPADGYCLFINPWFRNQPDAWPLLIAYHIPSVNYGDIVAPEDAEAFGAALLGIDTDTYYNALCELVDSIPLGD